MKRIIYLLLILIIAGCYKDSDEVIKETESILELTEVFVNTKISGYVLDFDGNRISGYTLIINDETFDVASEYFLISLKNAKQKRQTIFIEKDGIEIGIATVFLVENDINRFEFETFSKATSHVVKQDMVDINPISLDFSNSEFLDYSGIINVNYSSFRDQTNITNIGFSKLGQVKVIAPEQIFYLDFRKDNGSKLEFSEKSGVEITLKTNSKSNTLFHFNQDKELWEEIVEIHSNKFTVKVNSDGYYLLGNAKNGIFSKGTILKDHLSMAYHKMTWTSDACKVNYHSTLNGNWLTLLPENQNVAINLISECSDPITIKSILTENSDLKNQNINVEVGESILMDTEVVDCNGDFFENSTIEIDDQKLYSFEDADIKLWLPECDENIQLSVIDLSDNTAGLDANIHSEVLFGCKKIPIKYSFIKINGEEKIVNSFDYKVENGNAVFTAQNGSMKITLIGTGVGNYDENQVYISMNDPTFGSKGYFIQCEETGIGCGIDHCNISPNMIGEGWINLKFSGVLWMQTINPSIADNYTIEGLITAKID